MRKYYRTSNSTQLTYDIFIQSTFGLNRTLSTSPSDLKKLCKKMLKVLGKAIELNISTDKKHSKEIQFALEKLERSFKDEDFEPLYIIGLFQIIFLILGDLPNNWRRKVNIGRSFSLNAKRELIYNRNLDHKINTILSAHIQDEKFSEEISSSNLTNLFRKETKNNVRSREFIEWYSDKFPNLYSTLF